MIASIFVVALAGRALAGSQKAVERPVRSVSAPATMTTSLQSPVGGAAGSGSAQIIPLFPSASLPVAAPAAVGPFAGGVEAANSPMAPAVVPGATARASDALAAAGGGQTREERAVEQLHEQLADLKAQLHKAQDQVTVAGSLGADYKGGAGEAAASGRSRSVELKLAIKDAEKRLKAAKKENEPAAKRKYGELRGQLKKLQQDLAVQKEIAIQPASYAAEFRNSVSETQGRAYENIDRLSRDIDAKKDEINALLVDYPSFGGPLQRVGNMIRSKKKVSAGGTASP